MTEYSSSLYAFIMPHRNIGSLDNLILLKKSINNIFRQTDDKYFLIIVDDNSTCEATLIYLKELLRKYPDKLLVRFLSQRRGPAYCRNLALEIAIKYDFPVAMFNDADDISHIKRVEVTRKYFAKNQFYTILYSTFVPVDEKGIPIKPEYITPSISEILETHESKPPQGYDVWKDIGTKRGYINLTSAPSVCTKLAINFPFPNDEVSEDSHTWMRYSAGGGRFIFTNEIPVKYRVTTDGLGSSTRNRHRLNFYDEKARVDEDGFRKSINIALKNNSIKKQDEKYLIVGFYIRLSETMIKEEAFAVSDNLLKKSFRISTDLTLRYLKKNRTVSDYFYNHKSDGNENNPRAI